jgi:hypothetical protein
MRCALLLSLLLVGCHSSLTRNVEVSVSPAIAAAYNPSSPGLLVASMDGYATWHVPLCGQMLPVPTELFRGIFYACLGENGRPSRGDAESVRVWIAPLPAGWSPATVCSSFENRSVQSPKIEQAGEGRATLAQEPEAGWPQAVGTGTWKRDDSPCGGRLSVSLTLE